MEEEKTAGIAHRCNRFPNKSAKTRIFPEETEVNIGRWKEKIGQNDKSFYMYEREDLTAVSQNKKQPSAMDTPSQRAVL